MKGDVILTDEIKVKKPIYKRWWFWLIGIVVVFNLFNGDDESGNAGSDNNNVEVVSSEQNEPEPVEIEETESEPEPVENWTELELTKESIETALQDAEGVKTEKLTEDSLREIDILDHAGTEAPNDKIIHVKFNPGTVWDETDFAERVASSIVGYSEILFQHPNTEELVVWGLAEFTDEYGNKEENTGARISFTRSTFDKINFDSFHDMVLVEYWRAYSVSDSYMIHAGLYQNIKDFNGLPANK